MLMLENVCKQMGNDTVLNNINLSIENHSIIGLVGPSGSGKSTLLRCIQKLETIDSGKITFSGQSGFMFQDFQLFPHMTVLGNLLYAVNIKNPKKNNMELAMQLLSNLGLEHKSHHYPNHLSGGQKQRVALARSLMLKPDLLLCDEPTSGLDQGTIEEVITLIQYVHKQGISMIIASHDLNFLKKITHQIYILNHGQLFA